MVLPSPCPLQGELANILGRWEPYEESDRYLYLILRGAVAGRRVVQSLPLPKTTVLKYSHDQAPFHVFEESTGGEL